MKKVILISLDALSCNELAFLKKQPGFSRMIEKGSYCPNVYSVYPSVTFSCHASMDTGCLPAKHGIVSNHLIKPTAPKPPNNWYAKNIKRKTISDYAAEQNRKCLSVAWPMNAGNITAALCWPDVAPDDRTWDEDGLKRLRDIFSEYGKGEDFLERFFFSTPGLPEAWMRSDYPALDDLMLNTTYNMLTAYEWDIIMLHVFGMDSLKHDLGADHPDKYEVLKLYDQHISRFLDYVDNPPQNEDIALFVTGDHAALDIQKDVHINMLLEKMGLCRYENGRIVEWDAYFDTCDGMAQMYVRSGCDAEAIARQVSQSLEKHPAIVHCFFPKDIEELGCDRNAALAVEARQGYSISSVWNEKADQEYITESLEKATHGYLPSLPNYQTLFFAYGPSVAPGYVIDSMCIMDIFPTICTHLGIKTEPVDGKIVDGLFV